jgi:hypothetical protein
MSDTEGKEIKGAAVWNIQFISEPWPKLQVSNFVSMGNKFL